MPDKMKWTVFLYNFLLRGDKLITYKNDRIIYE